MLKFKWFFWFVALFLISGFIQEKGHKYPSVSQTSFSAGEVLKFKMSYGFFNVGKAEVRIQNRIKNVNNRQSYQIDVKGGTSGFVDWITHVDDHWGAYIDSSSLLTHVSYRNIIEGRYRRNEVIKVDYETQMMEMKVRNRKGIDLDPVHYEIQGDHRDMLGALLMFRSYNFDTIHVGDTINVKTFYTDEFYDFKMVYKGLTEVKTKVGEFRVHKVVPIMPENSIFDGEDSIVGYFSDDENKIPVRIEAKMFVGKAAIELVGYQGLKNDAAIIDSE